MSARAANLSDSDPILERLEDQLAWYDRKSLTNQRAYKRIKVVEILAAATVPFLAGLGLPHTSIVTGGLGVLITVLEGLLHLNQYQHNWINYRSTCQALKHEKYAYLGKAWPYANVPDPQTLLAQRIESLVSQEHAKWASVQQQEPNPQQREPVLPPRPSSQDIRIHVITQMGDSHPIDTPQDIRIDDFIREVVEGLDLPRIDAEGRAVNWTLDNKDTGKTLDPQSTLGESGVREDHHLHLRRAVVAGGYVEPTEKVSQLQLSVHYPPQVVPNVWSTLLTYVHVPDALRTIQDQTNLRLGRQIADRYLRTSGMAMRDVSQGAEITVIPTLPDCLVSPERTKFLWVEDWHCEEFQFKSIAEVRSEPLIGQVAFYMGPILICEIVVFIRLSGLVSLVKATTTTSNPYQAIFVLYCHEDSTIVEGLERVYGVLGMRYLRDIRILRSGEQWNSALLSKIEEADIFQLCWSHAAKRSEYVTQEWKHALGLSREYFLRPVYWQTPMPEPPLELASIHFAFLDMHA
jgi:hypothetical protein